MSIEKDLAICGGKPRIAGTGVTVEAIMLALAQGKTPDRIVKIAKTNGIGLNKENVLEAVSFCAERARSGKKH